MNVWTKISELFAATPPKQEKVVWPEEFERLRQVRAQRIALARKPTIIALPVREMK